MAACGQLKSTSLKLAARERTTGGTVAVDAAT
jgi:hypothetical protein